MAGLTIDIDRASVDEIIRALQKDKDAVFSQLVAVHHSGMVSVARSILGPDECEEAVQDAWISAYRGIDGFKGDSSLRTWFSSIVVNQCRMHLRKSGREINMDMETAQEDFPGRFRGDGSWLKPPSKWEFSTPDELLQEQNLADCIEKTFDALPSIQRLVLELRDIQGLSQEEICNMLDITSSNTRVLLHRARARLFNMVDHYEETGEC